MTATACPQERLGRTNTHDLTRILQSLLTNAIKHNGGLSQGVRIRVSCKVHGGLFLIHVADTGREIRTNELMQLFNKDYTTELADNECKGIGLSNVKRIVLSLPNHMIQVRSKEGRYTVFRLSLQAPSKGWRSR